MTDFRDWLQRVHHQRITANDVAEALGISRATATRKLLDGLDASDIITLCRKAHVNPIQALVDLGHLTDGEILDHLDDDGKRLVTAAPDELVFYLAQDMLSVDQKLALVRDVMSRTEQSAEGVDATVFELPNRQSARADTHDGTVTEWNEAEPSAADSSTDENEERIKRGEDPID